jgi:hypothetical protein
MAARRTKLCVLLLLLCVLSNLAILYFIKDQTADKDDELDFLNQTPQRSTKPAVPKSHVTTIWADAFKNDGVPTYYFSSLPEARQFMEAADIRRAQRLVIEYETYNKTRPRFISEEDETLFMQSTRNRQYLEPPKAEELRGVIEVVPNGTFKMDYRCGHQSDYSYVKTDRPYQSNNHYEILAPLIIPMGFLFQHFFDGTLPKIAQAYEFLLKEGVKILLERPHHKNVLALLSEFGIGRDRIVWHARGDTSTVYAARHLVLACVAPPVHPRLWTAIRGRLLPPPAAPATYVILLTRDHAKLGGRNMLNQKEVTAFLSRRYGPQFKVFHGDLGLTDSLALFSRARILIGTHGGAFYNLNYAPAGSAAAVVEAVPVLRHGRDIESLPHAIFWAQATMLGQDYWRVMCTSESRQHDCRLDVAGRLRPILDVIDGFAHPGTAL